MYGGSGSGGEVEETEQDRALAEAAAARYNWQAQHIGPLVDQFVADAEATESDYAQARGKASNAGQTAFAKAAAKATKALGNRGVRPGSGAWNDTMGDLSGAEGAAVGGRTAQANVGVRLDQDRRKMGIFQLGIGESASAMRGLGREAASAVGDSIHDANVAFDEAGAWQQVGGTAAGVGARMAMKPDTASLGGNDYSGHDLPEDNINAGTFNRPNL